jgi:hypothetical protein
MSDDYFSFMSNKGRENHSASRDVAVVKNPGRVAAIGPRIPCPTIPTDVIDFVEESQIEVTETFVSDTVIQRLFKRCGDA